MRFVPGCKCCTCTADATHVCVCSCLTPYHRTATIADNLGVHTMTFQPTASPVRWQTTGLLMPATISTLQGFPTFPQECLPASGTQQTPYNYVLTFSCNTLKWTLALTSTVISCKNTASDPLTLHYAAIGEPSGFSPTVNNAINIDCTNTTMLNFVLPTVYPGDTLPIPGGGGPLSVVF